MVKSILKGGKCYINPLVTIKPFSFQNFIPSGAEDLSNICGDVYLKIKKETPFLESFV
jgi:DNA/RNA-binding domain of Phe-tRNA-synthetase-like protein